MEFIFYRVSGAFQSGVIVSSTSTPGLVSQSGVLSSKLKTTTATNVANNNNGNTKISSNSNSMADAVATDKHVPSDSSSGSSDSSTNTGTAADIGTGNNNTTFCEHDSHTATVNNTSNNNTNTTTQCHISATTTHTHTQSVTHTQAGEHVIKVGIVSGRIHEGQISGDLVIGLLKVFNTIHTIHVTVFHTGAHISVSEPVSHDNLRVAVDKSANIVYILTMDLNQISTTIKAAKMDVLIYPEIGNDPITYFLSFARLAKTQLCWFGHPDTTGE